MDNRIEKFEDREKFAELIAEMKWYEAIPKSLANVIGDRFYEKCESRFSSALPTIPEVDGDVPTHYICTIAYRHNEEHGDTVVADIHDEETGDMSHTITFI